MMGVYGYSLALDRWLEQNLCRFDGVIIHGAWTYSSLAAAWACQKQRRSYGVFPHGMLERWAVNGQGAWKAFKKHLYWLLWERRVYEHARCVLFATRREQERTRPVFSLPSRQMILPVYGIESEMPRVSRPDNLALEKSQSERWALFLGRVHPKKNVDLLIRAWGRVRPPELWRLLIAGPADPDYRAALRRLISDLDLDAQIRLVDFVSGADKAYLFQQSEWFLLPSKQENFGVAVLEAIAHNCPVVLSDQVFLAESFPAGAEILPLEIDAWSEFFARRMADQAWRQVRLETDRKYLLEQFEMSRVARAWAEAIPRALVA